MNVNPTNSTRNDSRPKRRLGLATAVASAVVAGGMTLSAGMSAAAAPAAPTQVQAWETEEVEPTPPPPPGDGDPVEPPPPEEGEEREQTPPQDGERTPPEQGEQTPPQEGEQTPPEQGEQTPSEQGEQTPPQEGERTPPEQGEQDTGVQGGLPAEGEDAPTAQAPDFQNLTPEEIKKQVTALISESDLSAQEKAKVLKALDGLLKLATEGAPEDKDIASMLAQGLGEALRLSQDNNLSQEERDRFNKIARGISEASQKVFDPKASAEDLEVYANVLVDLNYVISGLTDSTLDAAAKAFYSKWADVLLGGLLAVEKPGTTSPPKPEDKKKVQEKLQKNAAALKVYQSADSSESERAAAKATLDEQARAVTDAKYLELVEELKRLKAPQACLDAVQTRTQQTGWPDGSLWGLTDKTCEDTVKAGAADSTSDWGALFDCIMNEPFSTCPARIPD